MRQEKGITLIALVITIIVMLILVAVSVTIAMQQGLFDNAKAAANGTNAAINAEQNLASGSVTINGTTTTINEFVAQ